MAIAIVQSKALAAGLPATLNSTSTAGNTIIWVAGCANNMTAGTPQYAGATWDSVSQPNAFPLWNVSNSNGVFNTPGSGIYLAGWVIPNAPAGTSLNFTTVVPSYTDSSMLLEVSGLGTTPTIESSIPVIGSGTGDRTTGVTPANVGVPAIVIGGSTGYAQVMAAPAAGNGFTNILGTTDNYGMGGYRILTTYGESCAYASTTASGSQIWATGIAVILPDASLLSTTNRKKFDNSGLRPHPFSPGLAR